MHKFRELKIWQRSMELVVRVYNATKLFPAEEKFGLVSQIRRSAVSIPSNISEGAGRSTDKQFKHFLEISMGSCNELQTQLELSFRFNYISEELVKKLTNEAVQVNKIILGFYNTLGD